jgi:hypothetical protein
MISMTVVILVLGLCLSTFLFCLKAMYRDMERLKTNASLRSFTAQISKETVDASEYYLFPLYTTLDGNINLATPPIDISAWVTDAFGTSLAYGDCLVLVTRVSEATANSAIRQFHLYYRSVTNSNSDGEVRFWESQDYGLASTQTDLVALLNTVNLKAAPVYPGSRILAKVARGRKAPGWTPTNQVYRPIFSTESATTSAANQNVSINVEFINGTSVNNLLSSSSFNYTISPRK